MRIAVIEDNEALAHGIAFRMQDTGHAVDLLHRGDDAALHLSQEGADLIVLDINLPGKDGLSLLRELRAAGDDTPVILLTARSETQDRVIGLDAGADDYLVKPFEMDELDARVRALARRRHETLRPLQRIGMAEYDPVGRQLFVDGTAVDVPRKEVAVFECLMRTPGRLVSKAALVDHVYGVGTDVDDSVIEVYVSRLRKRLADYGIVIKTARSLGYYIDISP